MIIRESLNMKKIILFTAIILSAIPLFADDDYNLARAKSQLGWAEGLMESVNSNPSYNSTEQNFNNINEYLSYAGELLDTVEENSQEKQKLVQWREKLIRDWEVMKKQYFKRFLTE